MSTLELLEEEFSRTRDPGVFLAIMEIQSLKQEIEILQGELRRAQLELQAADK